LRRAEAATVIKALDTPQIIEAIGRGEFDGIRIKQLMRALDERRLQNLSEQAQAV
jgi:hypothetical protein